LLGRPATIAALVVAAALLAAWIPHYLTWPLWIDADSRLMMARAWDDGRLPYRDIVTFNFPGEWDIICRFHPDMFLTIKVVGKAVPGAVAPTHNTKPPPPANDTDPTSGVPGISGLPVAPPQPRRS